MIAIISGASSGIGREFAYQIDDLDYDEIWLIARRKERLVELKQNLKTPVKILDLDLLDNYSFDFLVEELKQKHPKVDLLINSAGMGVNDYFENIDPYDEDKMIFLNVLAPTRLIKIVSPYMIPDSVIINVASVAGFMPQPKFATYAATKAYLISLSRSLNREFADRGIEVTALCPNPVDTEFGETHTKGIKKIATEDIHTLVRRSLRNARRKDVITTHWSAKIMLIVSKILPHSFVMWIEKKIGMY